MISEQRPEFGDCRHVLARRDIHGEPLLLSGGVKLGQPYPAGFGVGARNASQRGAPPQPQGTAQERGGPRVFPPLPGGTSIT